MTFIYLPFLSCADIDDNAGEGLGGSRKGIADPIMAGSVKKDNLGVGAVQPGEVTPEDDIYEQYKKRMMLGYRHRPNPLVIAPSIMNCFAVMSELLCNLVFIL